MDYKKSLNSDLFEEMMKYALIERYTGEVNSLKAGSEQRPFSEAFDKKVSRIIRKVGIKEQLKNVGKLAAKSLTIILMVLGVSFGILMTQPKVYAAVWDVVRTVFEDHDSYESISTSSDMTGREFDYSIAPTYIPEGFKLRNVFYGDFNMDLTYENSDDELEIRFSYGTKDGTKISIDNEQATYLEINENGVVYYIYESNKTEDNTVLWYTDEYYFMISAQINIDEIMKIIESISELQ